MVDHYKPQKYLDLGFTEEEALGQITAIKLKNRNGVIESCAKKRILKYNYDISVDKLLELENDIFSIPNSCSNHVKLHNIVTKLKENFPEITVQAALSRYKELLILFSDTKNPAKKTEFIRQLYGDSSVQYTSKLELNKGCATCSFESFSLLYDDKELARLEFNKTYGSNNLQGIMARHNIDEEEAKQKKSDRIDKGQETFNARPIEEKTAINATKSNSLENFIIRHGEHIGKLEFERYCDNKKGVGSYQYYVDLHGIEQGAIIYNEKKGRHNVFLCVEYWIHRGHTLEEATKILDDYFKQRPNFSLEYCIEKYGSIAAGTSVWKARQELWQQSLDARPQHEIDIANAKKSNSLDNCIFRHGVVLGVIRYNEIVESRIKSFNCGYSKESRNFFLKIYKRLRKLGVIERTDVFFGIKGSKEYWLKHKATSSIKFYDFTIPKLNYMAEYNGVVFHPRLGDTTWKSAYEASYEDTINNDILKYNLAEEYGYFIEYIWSDEDLQAAQNRIVMKIFELYELKETK